MHFDIRVIFSVIGCNAVGLDFSDVATMLGTVFPATFSGAIVYEQGRRPSDYGTVSYSKSDEMDTPPLSAIRMHSRLYWPMPDLWERRFPLTLRPVPLRLVLFPTQIAP